MHPAGARTAIVISMNEEEGTPQPPAVSADVPLETSYAGGEAFVQTLVGGGEAACVVDRSGPHSISLDGGLSKAVAVGKHTTYFAVGANLLALRSVSRTVSVFGTASAQIVALAIDGDGDVYAASRNCIEKFSHADAACTLIAGQNGQGGYNDATGEHARFACIQGMCVDGNMNLIVTDNHCLRQVNTTDKAVTTVAGDHRSAGHVDGDGPSARFNSPQGVAFDAGSGVFYVADHGNHRIRKVSADFRTSTIAGTGNGGFDDGRATAASFHSPIGVACVQGWVYVTQHTCIRCVSPTGVVTTVAGSGDGTAGYRDACGKSARMSAQLGHVATTVGEINDGGLFVFVDLGYLRVRAFEARVSAPQPAGTLPQTILDDLASLLNNKCKVADIRLKGTDSGERTVHSLKGILELRSEHFRNLLRSGMEESRSGVVKVESSHAALRAVIQFLHTDKLVVGDKEFCEVLDLAEEWQILPLKAACEREIGARINVNNVCEYLQAADLRNAQHLRAYAMTFVVNHIDRVKKTAGLKSLEKTLLLEIISESQFR